MKQIIALQAKAGSGKTATIKLLPAILLVNEYRPVPGIYQLHGIDFSDIYERVGKRVGITSAGDSYYVLHERLNDLVIAGCDICICTCSVYDRVTPATIAATLSFPGYVYRFLRKTYGTTEKAMTAANRKDAKSIYEMI